MQTKSRKASNERNLVKPDCIAQASTPTAKLSEELGFATKSEIVAFR